MQSLNLRPQRDGHLGRLLLTVFVTALSGAACIRPTAESDHRPFTVVMLPDTQIYSKAHPDLFFAQTQWIKANRDRENIRFVTQVGDIINDCVKDPKQWEVANKAMAVLDGAVPYGVAIGNHDFESRTAATSFIRYFGPERYAGCPWYGGASENKLNSFQLFSGGGVDFVILHLEIDAPDAAIAWATEVLKKYPTRAAIVATHAYLHGRDGITRSTKPAFNKGGNSAEELWDKFIRRNPQVFMILCGHEGRTDEYRQVSTNDAGNKVLEILADYQKRADGGQGYLRLIRFLPASRQIEFRTYSPSLKQFETDDSSQFTLPWELPASCIKPQAQPMASVR